MDSKGIFYSDNNRGLAAILDSNQTAQTQQRLDAQAQRKVTAQVKAKEDRDKQADQLKNFDAWRYYSPALQTEYDGIVNDLKAGNIDNFELKQRINDYATKAQSTIQLKGEYDGSVKDYEANKKVLGSAAEWYLNSYHKDPSVDNLKKISSSPLNRYGFLEEKGGSQHINTTEAFKDVIEKGLPGWIEQEVASPGKGKVIARGLMEFVGKNDISKLKSFTEVDPKTGKIQVKDADKLIESGVLDLFEQDAYTNRILEDQTDAIIGTSEVTPEDRTRLKTQVLRQMIQPYGATGEVKSTTDRKFSRYSVPSDNGGGGSGDDSSEARRIYDVFKSRSIGQGADVGEEKTYTDAMVKKYNLPNELVGKKFIESTALSGYKDEQGRSLGRIVYREGDKRFGGVARVEVISGKDKKGNDLKTWQSLTLNQLESFLPRKVYDQVEKLARDEGRIDASGNFIYDESINEY